MLNIVTNSDIQKRLKIQVKTYLDFQLTTLLLYKLIYEL